MVERMLAAIEGGVRRAIRAGRVSLRDCFLRAGGKRPGAYVQEVARALNAYLRA